eukprot:8959384-Pyramimonas_sp.AAC.1
MLSCGLELRSMRELRTSLDGVDLYWARREFVEFSQIGGYDRAGQTPCVAAGAQWPRVRQFPTGTGGQQRRPRCLKAAEILRHRVWECGCDKDHADYSLSAPLVPQAL